MRIPILVSLLAVVVAASAWAESYLAPAFPYLQFTNPIDLQDPGDGANRLFVAEQGGEIWAFERSESTSTRTKFLDITDKLTVSFEGGLLGLAFHPDYANNGYFYVNYVSDQLENVLARYTVSPDPDSADAASEIILLSQAQTSSFHNGGQLAFGPDGYLYVSRGDGGMSANAQDLTNLMGAILRIDVDKTSGNLNYAIPPDNPFAGNTSGHREETFAYGFRNPWRFGIDPVSGLCIVGDVGQATWEELVLLAAGANYGWPLMEGPDCFQPPSCDTTGVNPKPPLWSYTHDVGIAVVGGYFYRGTEHPVLSGKYIWGDYNAGKVWALTYIPGRPPTNQVVFSLGEAPGGFVWRILSFGVDADGEFYILASDGIVYRLKDVALHAADRPPLPNSSLLRVFPNPFASITTIRLDVVEPGHVQLTVYDVTGRRVRSLLDGNVAAGITSVEWDGTDGAEVRVPAGVYFCRLAVDGRAVDTRRVVLLK